MKLVNNRTQSKILFGSLIGNTVEIYDFIIYGTAAALIFNKLFFPSISPLAGILAAFATNAVGFGARPLGSLIFGHFGDRIGRRYTQVVTLLLTGSATALIGVLPTYQDVGVFAAFLLVMLRIVQGIGYGGEWGGAVLLATENGGRKGRGFRGSWPIIGEIMGVVFATISFSLVSLLSDSEFQAWGWRIPFLLSIPLTTVGIIIRMRLGETDLFAKLKTNKLLTNKPPVRELFQKQKRRLLLAVGTGAAHTLVFYTTTVFIYRYTEQLGIPKSTALLAVMIGSIVAMVTTPIAGLISDRIGRRYVMMAGTVLTVIFAFPFFWLVGTKVTGLIIVACVLMLGLAWAAILGPKPALLTELFPTKYRYSAVSLSYSINIAIVGGLTPIVATSLVAVTGGASWGVSLLMITASLITFTAVKLLPEGKDALEDDSQISPSSEERQITA